MRLLVRAELLEDLAAEEGERARRDEDGVEPGERAADEGGEGVLGALDVLHEALGARDLDGGRHGHDGRIPEVADGLEERVLRDERVRVEAADDVGARVAHARLAAIASRIAS